MFGRRASSTTGSPPPAAAKKRLLTVEIIDGKNLVPCARNGTSDPFINLQLIGLSGNEIKNETFKTTQKNGTIAPAWNEKFVFGNNYDLSGAADLPTLTLTVWHHGSLGVADVPMGEVSIPLDNINPSGDPTDQTYPLQISGRMKTVTGEVI